MTLNVSDSDIASFPQGTVLIVLLVLMAIIIFLPTKEVKNQTLSLFRVILPSWRFFDEAAPAPRLQYRILGGAASNEWIDAMPQLHHRWHSMFFNPEGNLFLAKQSLLERLENEIEQQLRNGLGGEELALILEQTTSFRLTENLVLEALRRVDSAPQGTEYQFRVLHRGGSAADSFLVSSIRTIDTVRPT